MDEDRDRIYQGVVKSAARCHGGGRGFMFVQAPDTGEVFAHHKNCTSPAGHRCLFRKGVLVSFKIGPGLKGNGKQALDVRIEQEAELPIWEESVITIWDGTHGWASRPCGCPVFVPGCLLPWGTKAYVGMRLRHRVEEEKDGKTAAAIDIEILPD